MDIKRYLCRILVPEIRTLAVWNVHLTLSHVLSMEMLEYGTTIMRWGPQRYGEKGYLDLLPMGRSIQFIVLSFMCCDTRTLSKDTKKALAFKLNTFSLIWI